MLSQAYLWDVNGEWLLEDFAQKEKPYPGGNPWHQALAQKFALSDTMAEFQANSIETFQAIMILSGVIGYSLIRFPVAL
jgi:hypothetical protein